MKYKAFMIKYAEIGTKGKNRYIFEDLLVRNINRKIKSLGEFAIRKERGRIFVEAKDEFDYEDVVTALTKVFGIVGICPIVVVDAEFETIKNKVIEYVGEAYKHKDFTFKVNTRRNDKSFPMNSMEVNAELGHYLLLEFPELSVDVHEPQEIINVEIRTTAAYIYSITIPGPGGLPVGTNGKGMALLSGGIDSPVATYMIAKRGVTMEAVYFHAPPFTSERAKQKVIDLASLVADYSGTIKLHVVNFADIQMAIYDNCPHEELTIIMKRYMIKIAEELAKRNDCQCIVTGESIGQVSSQTVASLYVINEVSTMPVFRPLIGMDKQEIIDISEKIGTYETSILPYEDCCTTFVAKHPVTRPVLSVIEKSESKLTGIIEPLYEKALETVETCLCRAK